MNLNLNTVTPAAPGAVTVTEVNYNAVHFLVTLARSVSACRMFELEIMLDSECGGAPELFLVPASS